ncbi:MAG: hypothetical protein Q9179_004847 [Wetmoreana sp. 5 TL-2023]
MVYIGKRDDGWDDGYDNNGNWWYSDTAEAIKWAVVAAIFLAVVLFFVGGYFHAKRRIRRGQPPLPYHRRTRYPPAQQFTFYRHQQGPYEMNPYPPPPPAYHSDMPPPPQYEPPQGGSKINPDQSYTAPPEPPPAAEASAAGPSSPALERRQSLREPYNAGAPQNEEAQLPPRPQSSSHSWNPLKRFK